MTHSAHASPRRANASRRIALSVALLSVAALAAPAVAQDAGWSTSCVTVLSGGAAPTAAASSQAKIAAGGFHGCALTSAGAVKCWGWNEYGQLGDGTVTDRLTPATVVGLGTGVVAIAGGGFHSCALTSGGAVKCWGQNYRGQIGDGTTTNRVTPVAVNALSSGVVAIAPGWVHNCALTSAGGIKCWGMNDAGQLGDGTRTNRLTPVDVSGLESGVVAMAAGWHHTCALNRVGAVRCWGRNNHGQLGNGTTASHNRRVAVSGLARGVVAIAAGGNHSCALTSAGAVKCWGDNLFGQLGDGTTTDRLTPTAVSGLARSSAIAAGSWHSCALTSAGAVKCWGSNFLGQLGDGTVIGRLTPVGVRGLATGVAAITAGDQYNCALTSAGAVKCWGWNKYGQLGDGTRINRLTPVDVVGF